MRVIDRRILNERIEKLEEKKNRFYQTELKRKNYNCKHTIWWIWADWSFYNETVNCEILLKKNYTFVRGTVLNWFKVYLQDREYITKITPSVSIDWQYDMVRHRDVVWPLVLFKRYTKLS